MGQYLSILSSCFPCMGGEGETGQTTITVRSTSACCRGEVRTISIKDEHLEEFREIIKNFIDKIEDKQSTVTQV